MPMTLLHFVMMKVRESNTTVSVRKARTRVETRIVNVVLVGVVLVGVALVGNALVGVARVGVALVGVALMGVVRGEEGADEGSGRVRAEVECLS